MDLIKQKFNNLVFFKVNEDDVHKLVELITEVSRLKPITADVSAFSWDSIANSIGKIYEQILED